MRLSKHDTTKSHEIPQLFTLKEESFVWVGAFVKQA